MRNITFLTIVFVHEAVSGPVCWAACKPPQGCGTERVSLTSSGGQASLDTGVPSISSDGVFVSFGTRSALIPSDLGGKPDVYVLNLRTNTLEIVSVNAAGLPANAASYSGGDLSEDGRFVSFLSAASDIVPGAGGGGNAEAFVRDRLLATTCLVSVTSTGTTAGAMFAPPISGDGRFGVFMTINSGVVPGDANGAPDVFVRDLQTGTTELVSVSLTGATGNAASMGGEPVDISRDGRYVCFASYASDLVNGDTNGVKDVFRRDRLTGITELVSVGVGGQSANGESWGSQCSADGRFVTFFSRASNLVPADTNSNWDVFVRDMIGGATRRISVASFGAQTSGLCGSPYISPCGRFASFLSTTPGLVPGDTNATWDVFLHDLLTKRTERVSVSSAGAEGNDWSAGAPLSSAADVLVFASRASNLVPNDTNGVTDVFVRRCVVPTSYCTATTNSLGCVPMMGIAVGMPSASAPQRFLLGARNIINQQTGLLLYSTAGPASQPFHGGTACVQAPVRRTPPQNSGGSTSGSDCSGTFALDFNAWIAAGVDPALVPGQFVWSQYWSRDPGFGTPHGWSLTDGVAFVIWW